MSGKIEIRFSIRARRELALLKAFDQRRIIEAVSAGLSYEPHVPNRNRKKLEAVEPSFDFQPPLWELRVGEYRVFYDGVVIDSATIVRSIRRKEPSQTTQEILR